MDVVKIRLQHQHGLDKSKLQYKGALDAARQIAQREGVAALWSGVTPTILRNGIQQATMFYSKHAIDSFLWGQKDGKKAEKLAVWQSMLSGLLASCPGLCLTNPFDVLKVGSPPPPPHPERIQPPTHPPTQHRPAWPWLPLNAAVEPPSNTLVSLLLSTRSCRRKGWVSCTEASSPVCSECPLVSHPPTHPPTHPPIRREREILLNSSHPPTHPHTYPTGMAITWAVSDQLVQWVEGGDKK